MTSQPAHALTCLDSADCTATAGGVLPMAQGPAIGDDPAESWVVNDRLLFVTSTAETGKEIWRTDLTQAGTALVKDINVGPDAGFVGGESAVLGNYLYFVGDNFVDGGELWRTDGTPAGTTVFKETQDGSGSGDPRHLTVAGDKLYWQAYTGAGWDLWVTDGTTAGTHRVVDLGGEVTSTYNAIPVPVGDQVYFVGISGGTQHLAVTDGTAAGTKLLGAFPGGISWFTYPRFRDADHRVLAAGSRLYFSADGESGHGRELWTSDGTLAGTTEVLDLTPGSGNSTLWPVGWWNGGLYFYNSGPTDQYQVYRAESASASRVGWSTNGVTKVLARDAQAFYFARNIGQTTAEVVRASATGAAPLEAPGVAAQSIAGGLLDGDTFFVAAVVQGAGDKVQAFDATTGDLLASSGGDSFTYRMPNVFRGTLVVPASDNGGAWHLVTRALRPRVTNTVAPSIVGTVRVGATLTARPGTWTPGATFGYQWVRSGGAIPGATGAVYSPRPADLGRSLSVLVTASRAGYLPGTQPSPAQTVTRGILTAPKPKVVGTPKAGRVLRVIPGAWTPGTALTFRWYSGGKPITGATSMKYRLKAKDRGKRIVVRVTGVKVGYARAIRRSVATVRVR